MTREQFISGVTFRVGFLTYKGANTFSYNANDYCILKQSRSSIDERVVVEAYECNVDKVGKVWFEGFTHVMKKKVVVRYKFEDLVEFKS